MTFIDTRPAEARTTLADLDALTAGLALVANEARAQGRRDAAAVAEVRRLLAEWAGPTDMTAAHVLAAIAKAVATTREALAELEALRPAPPEGP